MGSRAAVKRGNRKCIKKNKGEGGREKAKERERVREKDGQTERGTERDR